MKRYSPKLTLISSAVVFALSINQSLANTQSDSNVSSTEETQMESIEKITVYGRHNQLILNSGTATKSNMNLLQTPAAIVVVDSALLLDQGITTLQEAIRNVSGLTQDGNNYGIGDNLAIRGLGVNYTIDGMYAGADLGNSFNPTRSTTNIDSIEVLKGPATGLYGIGAAGGVINLIEKKPEFKESYQVRAQIGSWNQYGLMFDATAPIGKQTAYRFVGNIEESDGYRGLSSKRAEVYGSLLHQFSDNNEFVLSTAYIDDAVQIDSIGHPVRLIDLRLFEGVDLGSISASDLPNDPNGIGLQLSDAQRDQLAQSIALTDGARPFDLGDTALISPLSRPNEGKEFRIKLKHDYTFNDQWTLTQQLLHRSFDSDYIRQTGAYNYIYFDRRGTINLDPRAPLVIDGELYPFAARRQEYRNITAEETTWQYFADLSGQWSLGDVNGEHLVSINYENRDMKFQQRSIWDADDSRSDPVPYILDIRNPNWPEGSFDDYSPALRSKYDKSLTAFGISIQEVLYLTDALTARVGVAYTKLEQTYQNQISDGNPELDSDDSGNTYNVGLSYKITDQAAIFANASKGRTAFSVLGSLNGETDRPDSESESYDLGIRFTAFDNDLLASLVYFETSRTNLRYNNPMFEDNPDDPDFNISVPEFYFDLQDQTNGVELDVNFILNEKWSMNANATHQDANTVPGSFALVQDETPLKGIPENFASVWTNYALDMAALPAPLKLSFGVSYTDKRSINSAAFGVPVAFIDSYTRLDVAASYSYEAWNIRLNINNITDKLYYSSAMFLGGLPGAERNARLTLSYNF